MNHHHKTECNKILGDQNQKSKFQILTEQRKKKKKLSPSHLSCRKQNYGDCETLARKSQNETNYSLTTPQKQIIPHSLH